MRWDGVVEEDWGGCLIQESVQSVGVVQGGSHAMMAKKPKGTDWASCWFLFFRCCLGSRQVWPRFWGRDCIAPVQYSQGSTNFWNAWNVCQEDF